MVGQHYRYGVVIVMSLPGHGEVQMTIGGSMILEQILATTHFRIYRSIGGDSTDVNRKRFASRMMAYLMLRTIGEITPVINPNGPREYCSLLMETDLEDWTKKESSVAHIIK